MTRLATHLGLTLTLALVITASAVDATSSGPADADANRTLAETLSSAKWESRLHLDLQRPVDSRRVEKDDLRVGIIANAQNSRPRRLRLVRHNRKLAADEPIEQGGFSSVRPADKGNESGFHAGR